MSTRSFDEDENELDFSLGTSLVTEANTSKKLERRRRIEELFEERRLKEELTEFG